MPAPAQILAAVPILLLPGIAAVRVVLTPAEARRDPIRTVALAYAGFGLAAISIWVAAWSLGLSRTTALAAPLGLTVVLWLLRRRGGATPAEPAAGSPSHLRWLALVAVIAVLLMGVHYYPYGMERSDGVHRMASTDWEKHLAMAGAIAASSDFPPPHPYLHTVREPSYYFGFHLVAAAIHVAAGGGGDVFHLLVLLAALTTAAVPFATYLFARDLAPPGAALAAAAGASLLLGFDVVVWALETALATMAAWPLEPGLEGLRAAVPSTNVDYWIHNWERQFNAPIAAVMWSPHQVAGAVTAMLVLHLVWVRRRVGTVLLAGMLLASMAAVAAYLALGLALGVAAALLDEVVRRRMLPWATTIWSQWFGPGLVSLLLALPVAPVLVAGESSGLVLHVSEAGRWTNGALFTALTGPSQWAGLLDSPAIYLFEFGALGLLGGAEILRRWRGADLTQKQRTIAAIVIAVTAVVTVVRPPVTIGNNLYARALLVVWFGLAPFAGLAALRWRRGFVVAMVLVGLAGTAAHTLGSFAEGALFWATPAEHVATYRWLNDNTPRNAVVAVADPHQYGTAGFWLRRPRLIGTQRLALLFGADEEQFASAERRLAEVIDSPDPPTAAARLDALGADVVLLTDRDRQAHPGVTGTWAVPPCFRTTEHGSGWLTVERVDGAC